MRLPTASPAIVACAALFTGLTGSIEDRNPAARGCPRCREKEPRGVAATNRAMRPIDRTLQWSGIACSTFARATSLRGTRNSTISGNVAMVSHIISQKSFI